LKQRDFFKNGGRPEENLNSSQRLDLKKRGKDKDKNEMFIKDNCYNIAIPANRSQVYSHPYLMAEPRLAMDVVKFSDQKFAQTQLMYYFINGVVDYQIHVLIKDTCEYL
jgi:hypothetical protein